MLEGIRKFISWNKERETHNLSKNPNVGRPKKQADEKCSQLRVYIPNGTLEWLYSYKDKNNLSVSQQIREIVELYRRVIDDG